MNRKRRIVVCRQHKGECVHAACQCVKFDAVMI